MPQPPHDRHRQPGGLALDQVPGGGQLVGGGDHRRAERVAVRVGAAAQVVQDAYAGRADRHVRQPGAPGPPEGVGDEDAHVHAEQLPQSGAQGGGRGVRVLGQQQYRAGLGVGGVDAGRGHDQALPVLDDPQRAPARDDPYGLGVYRLLAGVGPDDPALRLGDDLRGDQQDVPVAQARLCVGDEAGQVVAGPDLRDPGDGPYLVRGHAHREASARASASRAIAAAAARSVIISGTARQAMPAASTSATASASAVSTSQPSRRPAP